MGNTYRSPHLRTLLASGRLLHFKRGEAVASTSTDIGVMMVVEGYVRRYLISNTGSLSVQIIYGPQDVFSLTKVYYMLLGQHLYKGPEEYHYQAMDKVKVFMLPVSTLEQATQTDPVLYKELFAEAGHHLKSCVQALENTSLVSARARVAHQLAYFAQEFGKDAPGGIRLAIPITHQDIADVLALTRETVSRAISELRHQDLIRGSRRIVIPDLDALWAEAYA